MGLLVPTDDNIPMAIDVFLGIFFMVGAAMPTWFICSTKHKKKLQILYAEKGQTVNGVVTNKRAQTKHSRNSDGDSRSVTHYYLTVVYTVDNDTVTKEFAANNRMFSNYFTNNPIGVIHLKDVTGDPRNAMLKENNNHSGLGGVVMMLIFFCIWNLALLLVSPWRTTPYWAYPLGFVFGYFCFRKNKDYQFENPTGNIQPANGHAYPGQIPTHTPVQQGFQAPQNYSIPIEQDYATVVQPTAPGYNDAPPAYNVHLIDT